MRFRRSIIATVWIAGALPAAASTEGGAGEALIRPELGTIFWTTVTFLALAFLLGRVAWRPLLGALEQRELSIRASIDQARSDREAAERLLAEQRELLDQARRERAEAVAAGQRDAESLKQEILAEARSQREQLLEQTEAQIRSGIRQARSELRAATVDLAILAAEKLLRAKLDDAGHRRLVEDYLSDLEKRTGPPPS